MKETRLFQGISRQSEMQIIITKLGLLSNLRFFFSPLKCYFVF